MPDPLPAWDKGKAAGTKRAARLNAMVEHARPWDSVSGNVSVARFLSGIGLNFTDTRRGIDIRPGIISAPPSSGLTVSPPYAWAKYARPKPGGIDTAVELELAPPPADTEAGSGFYTEPYPVLVRVVGPPGVSAAIGTEGLMVQVWDLGTETDPARPHWLFVTAGSGMLLVRLDSNVTAGTGGGGYNGTLMAGATTDDGSGNLALPEGLTVGASVLVRHVPEDGQPTHWLLADGTTYALGQYAGMSTEATPRPTILIPTGKARTASPTELGGAAEGTDAVRETTWDRAVDASGPLQKWYVSRVLYDHSTGTPELLAFMQYDLYDAAGRNSFTSAETRIVIDAPESCDADASPASPQSFMGL